MAKKKDKQPKKAAKQQRQSGQGAPYKKTPGLIAAALTLAAAAVFAFGFIVLPSASGSSGENLPIENSINIVNDTPSKQNVEPEQQGPSTSTDVISVDPNAATIEYPSGWLIANVNGWDAGTKVHILYLPDVDIVGHRLGQPIAAEENNAVRAAWTFPSYANNAVIECGGNVTVTEEENLLVNLPDIMPEACYNVVYSYSATSRAGGHELPGITGQRIDGYLQAPQPNNYLNLPAYIVPCAYQTAMKLRGVNDQLAGSGYKLLVYDAYRPMTAQYYLSQKFREAYDSSAEVRDALGDWSTEWYVSSGPSGHNFGTDVDAGVCDMAGTPLAMPSDFDAFDESGRLTDFQVNASDISPEMYRGEVAGNPACMALHSAFTNAGFNELASEWWHFSDDATAATVQNIAGGAGLDFVAAM